MEKRFTKNGRHRLCSLLDSPAGIKCFAFPAVGLLFTGSVVYAKGVPRPDMPAQIGHPVTFCCTFLMK